MDNRAKLILDRLSDLIPTPQSELNYKDNFQLIVAVVLSAQCTDKRVNEVTPNLFAKYPTALNLANADIEDVKRIIHSCGFYNNKAKNIIALSKDLVEKFDGVVPDQMDKLTSLAGVGRKTASVVLAVGFRIPAIPVDTHLIRVSQRLGLSTHSDPYHIEQDLRRRFDQGQWIDVHHYLLLFGRYYCTAINPQCANCVLKDICKYKKKQ